MTDLPPGLASALDDRLKGSRAIKIQCLLSDSDAAEGMSKARLPGGLSARAKLMRYGGFRHGEFDIRGGDGRAGILHTVQAGDELYAVTGDGAAFFSSCASRIIKSRYPGILAAAVNSGTMRRILLDYERGANKQLTPKAYCRKKIFGAERETERWTSRGAEGKRRTIEGEFDDAGNGGWHIDSMGVFSGPESDPRLDLSVSRKGLVSVYAGTFKDVFARLLRPIAREGAKSKKLFGKRGRSENARRALRPLLVDFGASVFHDEPARKRFSLIVAKYPNCRYAVMHEGSQHVYVAVRDRNDKSSFSVRTMGDRKLLIIPQIRSSAASLMRFSEFLNASFKEGTIRDCPVTPSGAIRE